MKKEENVGQEFNSIHSVVDWILRGKKMNVNLQFILDGLGLKG